MRRSVNVSLECRKDFHEHNGVIGQQEARPALTIQIVWRSMKSCVDAAVTTSRIDSARPGGQTPGGFLVLVKSTVCV